MIAVIIFMVFPCVVASLSGRQAGPGLLLVRQRRRSSLRRCVERHSTIRAIFRIIDVKQGVKRLDGAESHHIGAQAPAPCTLAGRGFRGVLSRFWLAFSGGLRYQDRMDNSSIDRLASSLLEALPQELGSLKADAETNFRAALAGGLRKMDLVTREEFDVQRAVLERTRAKLEALEARLASLESDDTG
jgi:BMFP domain-containing protein YqiC